MAGVQHFEDLKAWQKGRELAKTVYQATSGGRFARDFGLRDQIRRAAVSILSNIAEGFEREGNKELLQYLSLAKGSGGEARAQLYVALDQDYLTPQQFRSLLAQSVETSRVISGLMKYLRQSEMRGSKFRTLNFEL